MKRLFPIGLLLFAAVLIASRTPAAAQGGDTATSQPTSVATSSATAASTTPPYNVIGYFVQWGIYARNYRIKQVETSGSAAKLTHLIYAFANVSTDYKCYEETRFGWGDANADYGWLFSSAESVDGVADTFDQNLKGHFNQIKKLKALHPQLKVLMSIGGYSWSGRFSDAALPENRVAFVQSCIDLFIRGNLPKISGTRSGGPGSAAGVFDGIDIDWEFPNDPAFTGDPSRSLPPNVYRPEDKQNYTALLAEFRKQLDEVGKETGKHYLLTAAMSIGADKMANLEIPKIYPNLDFINLFTYDLHGAWAATGPTDFDAALYSSPDDPSPAPVGSYSVDYGVKAYEAQGVPANKLMVGIPFYGRGWTNVPNKNNGLYQSDPAMAPAPGQYEAGVNDYKVLKKLTAPIYRDPKTQAMWVYDGKTFWNYDDPITIAAKMDYIKKNSLGGTMFWSLDGDDGTLVKAIADGLQQ